MRVALDYRPALFSRSGIARSVRELARALRADGQEPVELFAHGYQKAHAELLADAIEVHGAQLHRSRLPGKSLGALARVGLDAARLSGGRSALGLFHWTDYVYPPVRAKTPVSMTVHDVAFAAADRWHGAAASRELRARFEGALRRCDAIAAPSAATRAMLHEHFDVRVPVDVIPFGVDHVDPQRVDASRGRMRVARELRIASTCERTPYFVQLGTLEPRKRHAEVLDAFEALAARGRPLPLVILGSDGWANEALKARIARVTARGLPIAWLRSLSDHAVYDIVAGAHALLYPSALEGFGFPPLEALELGVPAIVGECPSLRESCGDAALFVNGCEADDIAAAIERVLDDPSVRASSIQAWRTRRDRFTWARCAESYRAFWQRALGARR